ncbi:MAG TPA: class I SAM-dependent methyltransferase [Thermoguttaceae bacterium]|nr:class I SAM-dependent methyltransferase [Thermoguttaceae bacterium]
MFAGKGARETHYPEVAFGGFSDVDGRVAFFARVQALLEPAFVVVDAGCGRGVHAEDPVVFRRDLQCLRGKCKRVIGMDVRRPCRENPLIDEFRLIDGDRWPLDDESVDLCTSVNVLEHVEHPQAFFAECTRVLKTNGLLCLATPNALGYQAVAARIIPNRWHASVLGMLGSRAEPADVFPTLYRCNTVWKLRSMMRRHGFQACVYTYAGEPSYLRFFRIAYSFGVLFHRFAPRVLMPVLFAFGRKLPPMTAGVGERDRAPLARDQPETLGGGQAPKIGDRGQSALTD